MAISRIHGKEHPLQEIFNGDFIFRIPRYQRPYAWQIEQSETLLQDLLIAIGDLDDKADDVESYFWGSVVVVKEEYDKNADVVDGQQRLMTLTLLLAAIRSLTKDESDRIELTSLIYEKGKKFSNTSDHFHLTLRERDTAFFQNYIQKDITLEKLNTLNLADLSESQKNIVLNTRRYLEMLTPLSQDQLGNLATYIITQTFLIVVSTPNIESAYRIFSILNDRGLDLAYTDICKADVIGQIKDSHQDLFTEKWEEIEEQLGREGFKEIFSHIRIIHQKARLKETILKELKDHVLPAYEPEDFIDNVLVPYAQAYEVIKTKSYESDRSAEEINDILLWLGRIDNTDWMPVALRFYKQYKNKPKLLLQFLVELERLAASMMIRRENINTRQMRYIAILNCIDDGGDLFNSDSPLQLSQIEKKTTLDRLDSDIYHNTSRLYILRRLDAEYSENHITPELPVITVEHVLPQHPAEHSQWLRWYKDDESRKAWVHRLGNLALLSRKKNSQAQNFDFKTKKQSYFNSPLTPFALTTLIIKQSTWKVYVLEERQKESLKMLKSLWRL